MKDINGQRMVEEIKSTYLIFKDSFCLFIAQYSVETDTETLRSLFPLHISKFSDFILEFSDFFPPLTNPTLVNNTQNTLVCERTYQKGHRDTYCRDATQFLPADHWPAHSRRL